MRRPKTDRGEVIFLGDDVGRENDSGGKPVYSHPGCFGTKQLEASRTA
jgi:hypothetical protein